MDRKVIEIGGRQYIELPKGRKRRRTIYPSTTPADYPLASALAAHLDEARAEQSVGTNAEGLVFPSPRGRYWRSSNFARRILAPAYRAVAGAMPTVRVPGRGTACDTCSAPRRC